MRRIQYISLVYFLAFLVFSIKAEENSNFRMSIAKNKIYAGEKTQIKLQLKKKKSENFNLPVFRDTLTSKIEILNKSKVDTVIRDTHFVLSQQLEVTAFDSGFFVIPPVIISDVKNNKTLESEAMLLTVNLLPVDTTKSFKDIYGPLTVKIYWWEYWYYYLTFLIAIFSLILYIKYRRKKLNKPVEINSYAIQIPAHEKALKSLEELKNSDLLKVGNYKEYHTQLTEILRIYIHDRYHVNALEFTTEEILAAVKYLPVSGEQQLNLKNILQLADLAKFAKYTPMLSENEMVLELAIRFVENTKSISETVKQPTIA